MTWKDAIKIFFKEDSNNIPITCFVYKKGFIISIIGKYDPTNPFSRKYDPKKDKTTSAAVIVREDGKVSNFPTYMMFREETEKEIGSLTEVIQYEEVNDYYESLSQ